LSLHPVVQGFYSKPIEDWRKYFIAAPRGPDTAYGVQGEDVDRRTPSRPATNHVKPPKSTSSTLICR